MHRGTISGLTIAALSVGLVLPPAHVHLATDDHDHHHAAVEHAHWAAHHQARTGLEDADDDGQALFIDHPAIVRITHAPIAPPQTAVIELLAPHSPLGSPVITQRASGNAVRDGPAARSIFLRGPPLVL